MKRSEAVLAGPGVGAGAGTGDRRQYHQAREAFEYAYSMLEPFLQPDAGWQGRTLHHVSFNVVVENFPELASDEVHALLEAVNRTFVERHPGADGALVDSASA